MQRNVITRPTSARISHRRCFLATLRKNFQTDLHDILREAWQLASEQTDFWW